MEGKIVMSQRELSRLTAINLVINGAMSLAEGAEKMGVSYRQAKRIKGSVLTKGPLSLFNSQRP